MDIIEFARMGGQARANKLSASRRKEIAVNAINKRWGILASKNTTRTCIHGRNMPVDPKAFGSCGECNRLIIQTN